MRVDESNCRTSLIRDHFKRRHKNLTQMCHPPSTLSVMSTYDPLIGHCRHCWLLIGCKINAWGEWSKYLINPLQLLLSTKMNVPLSTHTEQRINCSQGTTSLDPLTFNPDPLAPYRHLILFDPRSFWYSSSINISLCSSLAWSDWLENSRNRFGFNFYSVGISQHIYRVL